MIRFLSVYLRSYLGDTLIFALQADLMAALRRVTKMLGLGLYGLTLILACIIYWQAREIARVTGSGVQGVAGLDLDFSLLEHVSPIEWG